MEGAPTGRQQIVFMQHANAWSMKLVQPISTQYRQAEHAALYRGMDFCWWKPRTRVACQKPPQAHIHKITHRHIHTQKLDQPFILTGTHTQAAPHTRKETAWCEMVWLHEVNEQQQPKAGRMTVRKAFLLYEKGVLTLLLWSSRDMSGAKSPCLHL